MSDRKINNKKIQHLNQVLHQQLEAIAYLLSESLIKDQKPEQSEKLVI